MKFQVLPNWCKTLGVFLFLIGSFIGGFEDMIIGFKDGASGAAYGYDSTRLEEPMIFRQIFGNMGVHIFEIIGIVGILVYMLSKEKVEDDFINKLRLESYQITSILWLISALGIYLFSGSFKFTLDTFLILFMFTYLIIFSIKKRTV